MYLYAFGKNKVEYAKVNEYNVKSAAKIKENKIRNIQYKIFTENNAFGKLKCMQPADIPECYLLSEKYLIIKYVFLTFSIFFFSKACQIILKS